ncbi:hypothetical protein PT974_02284 [Cladobotryum mycophilum]|uniref:DUF7709 domain-containing protein n=1 Tax=Cladobotryum mycophilum TaxID=491253 RepID=A0ABR0SYZ0_9HYPO
MADSQTANQPANGAAPLLSTEELQAINNKTMGTQANAFPVVTLPNGQKLPTGTIGALLVNIKTYDESDEEQRRALEPLIRSAIPVLKTVGIFGLFKPEEWITNGSPGRAFVGRLALEGGAI